MPKHPVPKKKTSKARTSRRYKNFQNRARIRLTNDAQLTECSSCKAPVKQHQACSECGNYRGKDMSKGTTSAKAATTTDTAKVKTIKA
jgi:large subunit ribosomal protein L32